MAESTAVAVLRAELEQARDALIDPIEGFRDFARAFISPDEDDADAKATEKVREYTERVTRIDAVLTALRALVEHGYPNVTPLSLSPEIYAMFNDNVRTQAAAFALVLPPDPAVSANIKPGPLS